MSSFFSSLNKIFSIGQSNVNQVETPILNIPQRRTEAKTGSEFIKSIYDLSGKLREELILTEIANGNVPEFYKLIPITVNDSKNYLTFFVASHHLVIGSSVNYFFTPVMAKTGQKIADSLNCILPTNTIIDIIFHNSINRLNPIPNGPPYDDTQSLTPAYEKANTNIFLQLAGKDLNALTSGEKKDYILTNRFVPNNPNQKICIYGWKKFDGSNVQPINAVSHSIGYVDYSQSVRLIYKDCYLNNNKVNILDILKDKVYSKLLNEEGILNFTSY